MHITKYLYFNMTINEIIKFEKKLFSGDYRGRWIYFSSKTESSLKDFIASDFAAFSLSKNSFSSSAIRIP
jgi:hypothetical protein